mgnify:FL=1
MPAATTYTTLQEDVRRYLERGSAADADVYEQIPRLITLAERNIARELKVQGFIRVMDTDFTSSVIAKPDRFREVVSINVGTGTGNTSRKTLLPRSYEYARSYWPDEAVTGEPEFYADYDVNHWLIVPTPDESYPAEVNYYEMPVLLDDTTQTNWLTEHAPQLLLYATLLQAAPFLKNDSRIPMWQAFFDRAMAALGAEDLSKIDDRAATRKEA